MSTRVFIQVACLCGGMLCYIFGSNVRHDLNIFAGLLMGVVIGLGLGTLNGLKAP